MKKLFKDFYYFIYSKELFRRIFKFIFFSFPARWRKHNCVDINFVVAFSLRKYLIRSVVTFEFEDTFIQSDKNLLRTNRVLVRQSVSLVNVQVCVRSAIRSGSSGGGISVSANAKQKKLRKFRNKHHFIFELILIQSYTTLHAKFSVSEF